MLGWVYLYQFTLLNPGWLKRDEREMHLGELQIHQQEIWDCRVIFRVCKDTLQCFTVRQFMHRQNKRQTSYSNLSTCGEPKSGF